MSPFNVDCRYARHKARKRGIDIPKRAPGVKPKVFDNFLVRNGECIEWVGARNRDGYGEYNFKGKKRMAHRHAWELVNGEIPNGAIIRHACDNPPCCNVSHLLIGTSADNVADKVSRGRQAKGERHGCAVLSDDLVIQMRIEYAAGGITQKALADKYGFGVDVVRRAVLGLNWKHVDGPVKKR